MKCFIRMVVAACPLLLTAPPAFSGDVGLGELMSRLQTYSHKLQLSVDAGNKPLAQFYIHEIEEVIEEIEEVEEYDGHPVGKLTRDMLIPAFSNVETAVDREIRTAGTAFDSMINACNSCHQVTDHSQIVIRRNDSNLYLQSFEARP